MLPAMEDFLLTTAEEAGIKYHITAARAERMLVLPIQSGGVPSTTIGVCARQASILATKLYYGRLCLLS